MGANRRCFWLLLSLVGSIGLAAGAGSAHAAGYLKLGDIKGESTDDGHKDEIEIVSFHWGLSTQSSSSFTARQGRSSLDDIVVVKKLDKSSPKLAQAAADGTHLPTAVLDFTRSGEDRSSYYKWELKNVLVTGYQVSGNADAIPSDQFSLNFEEIKITYVVIDQAGRPKEQVVFQASRR